MASRIGMYRNYSAHLQTSSEPPSESSSSYRLNPYATEQDDYQYQYSYDGPFQPEFRVPRRPLQPTKGEELELIDNVAITKNKRANPNDDSDRERIYWVTVVTAILLFMLGLGAAIGHYVYFTMLNEKPIGDQTWTLRYSLAIAFVFKSTLTASISIALAQHVWLMLQHRKGMAIFTIDAMFLAESSLFRFLSPSLWLSALSTALMAACMWSMPLTALVAPTALTVGTSVINTTDENCIVPTLDMSVARDFTNTTYARALFVTNDGDTAFHPSISSERLVSSVLTNGQDIPWQSPCGPTCDYEVQFNGPSWQCTQAEDVDDQRAPWSAMDEKSYWYVGDYADDPDLPVEAANASLLIWEPVYYAGLNGSTNQFWLGFAAGFARGLDPSEGLLGHSLRDILDVQAFYCQVVNTSYNLQVSYRNGVQTNTLNETNPFSILEIPPEGWNLQGNYAGSNESENSLAVPLQDIVGLYTPMVRMISGWINRDPRTELSANTSLGLVPSLISNFSIPTTYASETPYLPHSDIGPLVQQLSYNLTISLLSDPTLLVRRTTTAICYKSSTESVWKFNRWPLIIAYAAGLGVTMICLCIGAYALVKNRVSHDASFSSILRTTRNDNLDSLCTSRDIGALPLSSKVGKQRLRVIDIEPFDSSAQNEMRTRRGFTLVS